MHTHNEISLSETVTGVYFKKIIESLCSTFTIKLLGINLEIKAHETRNIHAFCTALGPSLLLHVLILGASQENTSDPVFLKAPID